MRTQPFSEEKDILKSDIAVGDVVKFIHEPTYTTKGYTDTGLVTELGDRCLNYLVLDPESIINGWVSTAYYQDRGMAPHNHNGLDLWSPVNHTQETGVNVSATPLSEETATRLGDLFSRIDARIAANGLEKTPSSEIRLALGGLIAQSLHGDRALGVESPPA